MPTSVTIALDIMSGDDGPHPALMGAFKSLELIDDLKIILVGDQNMIEASMLNIESSIKDRLEILHTEEFIKMDEDIISAIKEQSEKYLDALESKSMA